MVGGCGTEEPARYRVAVAVFAKAGIGIEECLSKDEMRSRRYPSFDLLLREKKG